MRRRAVLVRILSLAVLAAPALLPHHAAAGGLEYTAAGATALGRGGAVTARADDPMVLAYNPAGLVELRGSQLLIDANIALMDACVDPIGYYGWGVYQGGSPSRFTDSKTGKSTILNLGQPDATTGTLGPAELAYYKDELDRVCLDQHIVPVPQLIFTSRLSEDFGIGGGFVFPAISPTGRWGDDYGLIRGDTGGLRPAATRYMLLNSGNFGVFPNIGAAYRVTKWLRVGAAFEWGLLWVDTTTMAGVGPGTNPANDVIARVHARDLFLPAITASVHVVPNDNIDAVIAFRWQDDVDANGFLDVTTGAFNARSRPRTTNGLVVDHVKQNMPWKLRAGVRYSERFAPRPTGTGGAGEGGYYAEPLHDALEDERWDAELDVEYQMNSRNKEQHLTYQANQLVEFEDLMGNVSTATFPDISAQETFIGKHWKDQVVVRAGGTYNIFPGLFSVMGGAHFENRGIDPDYMQVDFWPVQRVGLHGGITFRLLGTTDIVFSYAHIFQESITVAAPDHLDSDKAYDIYADPNGKHVVTTIDKRVGTRLSRADPLPEPLLEKNPPKNPDGVARVQQVSQKVPRPDTPWLTNTGKYSSSMNVVAVGVHAHF